MRAWGRAKARNFWIARSIVGRDSLQSACERYPLKLLVLDKHCSVA